MHDDDGLVDARREWQLVEDLGEEVHDRAVVLRKHLALKPVPYDDDQEEGGRGAPEQQQQSDDAGEMPRGDKR